MFLSKIPNVALHTSVLEPFTGGTGSYRTDIV
jgi:hypothetical protein